MQLSNGVPACKTFNATHLSSFQTFARPGAISSFGGGTEKATQMHAPQSLLPKISIAVWPPITWRHTYSRCSLRLSASRSQSISIQATSWNPSAGSFQLTRLLPLPTMKRRQRLAGTCFCEARRVRFKASPQWPTFDCWVWRHALLSAPFEGRHWSSVRSTIFTGRNETMPRLHKSV